MAIIRTKHTHKEIRGFPAGPHKTALLGKFLKPKFGGENTVFIDLLSQEKVVTENLIALRKTIKDLCPHARNRQVIYSWRKHFTKHYMPEDVITNRFEVRCEACNTIVKEGSI